MPSRIACAAANASRCAPRTCRAPTCCTRRATRFSQPRCSSKHFSMKSRHAAASRSSTGMSCRTSPITAPSATSASRPVPSDIDFGDVSMGMRDLLRRMQKKRFNPGTAASMFFLNATNPQTIKVARKVMIDWGYTLQRLGNRALQHARQIANPAAAGDHRQDADQGTGRSLRQQANARRPAEAHGARVARHRRPQLRAHHSRSQRASARESEAVFYFPGCGSERLFSQVGLATQAMLWHVGVQTVLPPGYLCCGYPQRGAGEFDKAEKIITDNRVLFHRVANTLELSRHQNRAWSAAAPASINCRDMNSRAYFPAPKSWTSMSTCSKRACAWKMSPAPATCIMTPVIHR